MTIKEISEKFEIPVKDGVMNLGWENGWSDKTTNAAHSIRKFMVDGTYFRTGPASWQKIEFKAKDEEQEVKVTYQLDSGG